MTLPADSMRETEMAALHIGNTLRQWFAGMAAGTAAGAAAGAAAGTAAGAAPGAAPGTAAGTAPDTAPGMMGAEMIAGLVAAAVLPLVGGPALLAFAAAAAAAAYVTAPDDDFGAHCAVAAVVCVVIFRCVYRVAVAAGADADAASRVAAVLHAATAAGMAAAHLATTGPPGGSSYLDDSVLGSSYAGGVYSRFITAWSLGYLAHDAELIVGVLATAGVDWGMAAHHAVFAALIAIGGPRCPSASARALLGEAAVPPLYLGWWLARGGGARGRRWPRLQAANSAVVLAAFIALRAINYIMLIPAAMLVGSAAVPPAVALAGMNVFWTYRLAVRCVKSFAPPVVAEKTNAAAAVRRLRARSD